MSGERKVKYLLPALFAAFTGYLSLLYLEDRIDERDYSVIPTAELRVGFCMFTSVSPYEKYALAQSIVRPPFNPESYSVVLTQSLVGEPTMQNVGAIQAMRDREDLRQRAAHMALRIAGKCGYDRIAQPTDQTALNFLVRWLQYDEGYSFFLHRERQSVPDNAEQIYRLVLSRIPKTGITPTRRN